MRAKRKGKRLRVRLRRRDEFSGRCAGRLIVKPVGSRARKSVHFDFGRLPPSKGGPKRRVAKLKLSRRLRRAIRPGSKVRLTARPYLGFDERSRRRVR